MILYVNGDSHSAGAEAANDYAFAEDDQKYHELKRMPHPDNLEVSYGQQLANKIGAKLICDAESASSNHRVIRTTHEYLKRETPDFVVIGWSTWERKEFHDPFTGVKWQVNAGGIGHDWPQWLKDIYPKYISEIDWNRETILSHNKLFQFHQDLQHLSIPHLFFNTYSYFDLAQERQLDWDGCYVEPYSKDGTYYNWCLQNGFKPVKPGSYHFGADAHAAWANHLYALIVQKLLTR